MIKELPKEGDIVVFLNYPLAWSITPPHKQVTNYDAEPTRHLIRVKDYIPQITDHEEGALSLGTTMKAEDLTIPEGRVSVTWPREDDTRILQHFTLPTEDDLKTAVRE